MIFIKRLPQPAIGEKLSVEKQRLQGYVRHVQEILRTDSISSYFTSRFHFKSIDILDKLWFQQLRKQFNNKCAYCEGEISLNGRSLDYFRPINGIKGESEISYSFHYIWFVPLAIHIKETSFPLNLSELHLIKVYRTNCHYLLIHVMNIRKIIYILINLGRC